MFFRIYTIAYMLFYLYLSFNQEAVSRYGIWEWVEITVVVTAFAGMASYAFQTRLLTRRFWVYYRYIFIIFELVYMTWLQQPLLEKLEVEQYATSSNLINVILFAPVVYALVQLEKRWNKLFPEKKALS
jgi:hypothetical protein